MDDKFAPPSAGQKKKFSAAPRPARAQRGAYEENARVGREERGAFKKNARGENKRPPLKREGRREEPDKAERIAKRLARAGVASRREAETMIAAGRVAVNGRALETPAFNVRRADKITIDGAALPVKERTRLWLYHKPAGLITSARDEQGRATVFDSLPASLPRVVSVGRLDMNTEGLLLLTNDGGLARILELPSTGWVRHYRVRVHGKVSQEQLDSLKTGLAVDGVFYSGAEAALEREQGSNAWISIALREGKNREIKNILGALGLAVTRLIRTSFGPFRLGDLSSGMVLEVRGRALREQLGEKLAEEADLDFDAPIIAPFPNAPVATRPARAPRFADGDVFRADKAARRLDNEPRGGAEEDAPEEGWISSSRGRRIFPATPAPMPRRAARSANVWHAPGSKARAARREEPEEGQRFARGGSRASEKRRDGQERRFERKQSGRGFSSERGKNERGFGAGRGGNERRFEGKKPCQPRPEGRFDGRDRDSGGARQAGAPRAAPGGNGRAPSGRKFEGAGRSFDSAKRGGFKTGGGKRGGAPAGGKAQFRGFKPRGG